MEQTGSHKEVITSREGKWRWGSCPAWFPALLMDLQK